MNTITVQISELCTGYRNKVVTRGVNASLLAGQLTCLLGPNGAGKSTLLKTMSGFARPLSGVVQIEGTDITRLDSKALARLVGVVLTEKPQVQNMTVQELVAMGRSPYTGFFGGMNSADLQIVQRSINLVGIDELSQRPLHCLSDGERQKAMIAKALAQQTPIILLDEPTAFLDYPSKVEIMRLLYNVAHAEGKTIFMSTHNIELALQIADSLWLLHKQMGLRSGTPAELAGNGSLQECFRSDNLSFDNESGTFRIVR